MGNPVFGFRFSVFGGAIWVTVGDAPLHCCRLETFPEVPGAWRLLGHP